MRNALIESGESLSAPVDVGVGIPAGWAAGATAITFQASHDGVTWQDLYNDTGTEVSATAAASRNVSLSSIALDLAPWRFIKIRSGTSASAVTQEGNVISQYSPAGNRYGIRYSELISFMIGAM